MRARNCSSVVSIRATCAPKCHRLHTHATYPIHQFSPYVEVDYGQIRRIRRPFTASQPIDTQIACAGALNENTVAMTLCMCVCRASASSMRNSNAPTPKHWCDDSICVRVCSNNVYWAGARKHTHLQLVAVQDWPTVVHVKARTRSARTRWVYRLAKQSRSCARVCVQLVTVQHWPQLMTRRRFCASVIT
jgi:hypothetical protein